MMNLFLGPFSVLRRPFSQQLPRRPPSPSPPLGQLGRRPRDVGHRPARTSLARLPLQFPQTAFVSLRCSYSSRPFDAIDEDNNHLSSIDRHHPTLEQSDPILRDRQPSSKDGSQATIRSSAVTFKTLQELYQKQVPITMLTAYDFATARMVGMSVSNQSIPSIQGPVGIDICLCGDSLANVCLGYQSTTELGLTEFTYHLRSIRRGLDTLRQEPYFRIPLFIADLPFGTFESSVERGIETATQLIQSARVDGFKIEGGKELEPLIRRLTNFGIPVIGHIGLTPQRATSLGGFKAQGHDCANKARQIIIDALDLERSGCIAIVIEAVPIEIVKELKKNLNIPLIGIGAGPQTDGQVLVLSDLIGSLASNSKMINLKKPKFVPNFSNLINLNSDSNHPTFDLSIQIILTYIKQVRNRLFPQIGLHTYHMKPEVLSELHRIGWPS